MSQVVLLVPDADPLISLARGGVLDLLLRLNLPIIIPDQVEFEVTRRDDLRDAQTIKTFCLDNPDRVQIFVTEVGSMAAERRAAGQTGRQRGLGEASIAETLNRLDEIVDDPDAPVLLLFEDDDVRRSSFVVPGNVHVLSTWSLLLGMEHRQLIPPAQSVWDAIVSAGRIPAKTEVDKPGTTPASKTDW